MDARVTFVQWTMKFGSRLGKTPWGRGRSRGLGQVGVGSGSALGSGLRKIQTHLTQVTCKVRAPVRVWFSCDHSCRRPFSCGHRRCCCRHGRIETVVVIVVVVVVEEDSTIVVVIVVIENLRGTALKPTGFIAKPHARRMLVCLGSPQLFSCWDSQRR